MLPARPPRAALHRTTKTTASPSDGTLLCSKDSKTCAQYLNDMYYGFDESDKDSPLGVALRGRREFLEDEHWFFCEDQCFENDGYAFADCNVQSSLINHKVMVAAGSNTPLWNPDDGAQADYYAYRVFAIFYTDVVREKLTRCSYQYDGSTFNRGNGGCGLGMGTNGCDDETSAYGGKCPDEGSDLFAYQDGCNATYNEWCGSENMENASYPTICYWKGAAWNSPSNAGAQADMSALSTTNDELPEMLQQRLSSQLDGQTESGIPLQTYWNELVIDGRVLNKLLASEPESAVAAWGYLQNGGDSPEIAAEDARVLEEAKKFRDDHQARYGVKVPLVSLSVRADVSKKEAVFGPGPEDPEESTTQAPSEGPTTQVPSDGPSDPIWL